MKTRRFGMKLLVHKERLGDVTKTAYENILGYFIFQSTCIKKYDLKTATLGVSVAEVCLFKYSLNYLVLKCAKILHRLHIMFLSTISGFICKKKKTLIHTIDQIRMFINIQVDHTCGQTTFIQSTVEVACFS